MLGIVLRAGRRRTKCPGIISIKCYHRLLLFSSLFLTITPHTIRSLWSINLSHFCNFFPLRLRDEKPLKRPKTGEKSSREKTIAPFECQNTQYSPPWEEHFLKNHIPLSSNHFPLRLWHFVPVDLFPGSENGA